MGKSWVYCIDSYHNPTFMVIVTAQWDKTEQVLLRTSTEVLAVGSRQDTWQRKATSWHWGAWRHPSTSLLKWLYPRTWRGCRNTTITSWRWWGKFRLHVSVQCGVGITHSWSFASAVPAQPAMGPSSSWADQRQQNSPGMRVWTHEGPWDWTWSTHGLNQVVGWINGENCLILCWVLVTYCLQQEEVVVCFHRRHHVMTIIRLMAEAVLEESFTVLFHILHNWPQFLSRSCDNHQISVLTQTTLAESSRNLQTDTKNHILYSYMYVRI